MNGRAVTSGLPSVFTVNRESCLKSRARDLVRRAREAGVHVLLCTDETLDLAVAAMLYGWVEKRYHLCVRNGGDAPGCHNVHSRTIEV